MPDATRWEARYQTADTPWDLHAAAPPFQELLGRADAPSPGNTIVLGCGRGYDARYWAGQGHTVTAVDFAPSAIAAAQALDPQHQVRWLVSDIFALTPTYTGQFDYVVEHTCFCALEPTLRPAYVHLVADLLAPHGQLIGLFWAHTRAGGPPYGTTLAELKNLFSPYFETDCVEQPHNSIAKRRGEEYLVRWPKPVLNQATAVARQ